MVEITRVAIDTSKSVFTLHGVDAKGQAMLRRNLRRQEMVSFFAKLPSADVVMEARRIAPLGAHAAGFGPSPSAHSGTICKAVRQT
jgi:hypothetical protein